MRPNNIFNKKYGFTLAEVLITLVIIGVVATISTPVIQNHSKWAQYESGVKRAKSTLDQGLLRYSVDNGNFISCGYWKVNPYGGGGTCKGYDSKGNCTGWVFKETGGALPGDYNGRFDDCTYVYASFLQNMNVVKVCESNAYEKGCIAENMEGIDTIYKGKNEGTDDYSANKATAGTSGFRKQNIRNGKAFVTADGMIFIPYTTFHMPIMLVDVNGQKGPNKWGHDIHGFIAKINDIKSNPSFLPYIQSTQYVERGGRTTYHLLYGKTH